MKARHVVVLTLGFALLGASPALATSTRATRTSAAATAKVEVGNAARVSGVVSPSRPGKAVVLQQLSGKTWKAIVNGKLDKNSHYVFVRSEPVKGAFTYRVLKTAETGYAASTSPAVKTMVVAKVRSLTTTYQPVAGDSNSAESTSLDTSGTSNGKAYPHSILMEYGNCSRCGVAFEEYAVGGGWGSFGTTVGIEDDSPSGSTAKIEILTDGRSAATTKVGLGQVVRLVVGMARVQRVRIQVTAADTVHVVIGTPVVSSDAVKNATSRPVAAWLRDVAVVQTDSNYAYSEPLSLSRLGGDYFGNSLGFDEYDGCGGSCGSGYTERSLGRAYTTMTFRLGLDDLAANGSSTVSITGDGATLWSGTASLGGTTFVSVDTTNVLRLRITVTGSQGVSTQLADVRLYK